MHRRATMVLLAAIGSMGLAACGGSDDKKSDSGLAKSELVAKADAICKAAEKSLDAVDAPTNIQDANEAAAFFEKVAPLHQKETDDLAALTPAADVKADWDAFMARQNANNELLKVIVAKARAKDASGLEDVKKIDAYDAPYSAAAKKLGATACA